jgi:hypothetical protein
MRRDTCFILVIMALSASSLLAQERTAPYVRTLPSSSILYPGQQFRLYVEADNHNLDGHRTTYAQYDFNSPEAFEYVPDSAQAPETNDFFEGEDTVDSINEPDDLIGTFGYRFDFDNGVADRRGYVAQYDFIVPIGLTGSYTFDLDPEATTINDIDGEPQDRTLYAEPVTIAGAGDATLDGRVNVADFKALAGHWMQSGLDVSTSWLNGDFTGDGAVNVDDLGLLAENWSTNPSSALTLFQSLDPGFAGSQPVPEPLAVSVLLLPALLLRRRRA